jgi:anti-sigma B factor antagonist
VDDDRTETQVTVDDRGGVCVITARGDIDLVTAPELQDACDRCIDRGVRRLVIDLEAVDFIDSTSLRVLITALKRLRSLGGALALAGPQPQTLRVFKVTGLDKEFPMHGSLREALASEP